MLHGPLISSFFGLTAPLVAGKGYKLWSSSSRNFIHSPTTSSILLQNILASVISSSTLNARIFLLTVWHVDTTENCSILKPKIRKTTCLPCLSGNLSHRRVRCTSDASHFRRLKTASLLTHSWLPLPSLIGNKLNPKYLKTQWKLSV